MEVETGFGIVRINAGDMVRFMYHETMRQGVVDYVRVTKAGDTIVNVVENDNHKSYRADRMESAIEIL